MPFVRSGSRKHILANHFKSRQNHIERYDMLDLYPLIFKRRSFHLVRNTGEEHLDETQLDEILSIYPQLDPLYPDIRTAIRILPEQQSGCRRGNEYTICFYSEKKEGYLPNIGYLGEQLDLWLAERNIGTLWFGIGKETETFEDLDFVIMMGIRKVPADRFRKDMFKAKRKDLSEIWKASAHADIGNIVRFAPSACNTQPWIVEGDERQLDVCRYRKAGKRGIMPVQMVLFYNRIDIGIFLCFLELCLQQNRISYQRELFPDLEDREKNLVASYRIETE